MLKIFCVMLMTFSFAYSCALCGNNKASFVNVSLTPSLSDGKIQKIHVNWKFDSATSKDFKTLYSEHIVESDKKRMYDALERLQIPYFMTSILINGKNTSFKAENFTLFFENQLVSIEFDIPLDYKLNDKNNVEIIFVDSTKAIVFLEDLDQTHIINTTEYNVQKSNGFKVIKEIMAAVNYIKLDISKWIL